MASEITVKGLTELIVSLDKATSRLDPEAQAVLGKAGLNIKKGVRRRWSGLRHLRGLARTVGYDVAHGLSGPYVEIGADKRGQGELANVAEFGTPNNAPIPALAPELDAEAPRTVAALDALMDKLLS